MRVEERVVQMVEVRVVEEGPGLVEEAEEYEGEIWDEVGAVLVFLWEDALAD